MEMQALVEEIALLVEKIKNGSATLGELEAFASATNTLNERAIILRHKAYEAQVYGISTSLQEEGFEEEKGKNKIEVTETEEITEEIPEVVFEETSEPIELETESTAAEEDISFDLFSMDDVSTDFDSAQDIKPVEESTPVNEEVIEEPEETQPAVDETIEYDQEEDPMLQPLGEEASVLEAEPEIIAVVGEERITDPVEEPLQEKVIPQQPVITDEHPVVRKALTNDGTLQARILTVRLETLKSAFGLNERLQIVQELFKGSNDAYTTAIEQLDSQTDKSAARALVNSLAHNYSWKEDSKVALEFIQKVERRYA